MKVSIVSAYTNSRGIINSFLDNLQDLIHKDCEVIIVNNGACAINHPVITKRVDLPKKTFYAQSFNAGLKEATGDYIIQLSNDVFPEDANWINRLIISIKDTDYGLVSPLIRNDPRGYLNHRLFSFTPLTTIYSGFSLPAHCWIIRKEHLIFYDESFTGFHCEDDDYCRQLIKRGLNLGVCHNVVVQHHHKFKDTKNQQLEEAIVFNKKVFYKKWGIQL